VSAEASEDARRFLRRLGAVPELAMRAALWREAFSTLNPEALRAHVRAVLDALPARGPDARLAYEALLRHLEWQNEGFSLVFLFAEVGPHDARLEGAEDARVALLKAAIGGQGGLLRTLRRDLDERAARHRPDVKVGPARQRCR
jgi:hypothetical protein